MIEIAASTAFMIYLGITMLALFTVWTVHHWKTRNKTIAPSRVTLRMCEYCQQVYVEDAARPVTQCPSCKSFNKNNQYAGMEE